LVGNHRAAVDGFSELITVIALTKSYENFNEKKNPQNIRSTHGQVCLLFYDPEKQLSYQAEQKGSQPYMLILDEGESLKQSHFFLLTQAFPPT